MTTVTPKFLMVTIIACLSWQHVAVYLSRDIITSMHISWIGNSKLSVGPNVNVCLVVCLSVLGLWETDDLQFHCIFLGHDSTMKSKRSWGLIMCVNEMVLTSVNMIEPLFSTLEISHWTGQGWRTSLFGLDIEEYINSSVDVPIHNPATFLETQERLEQLTAEQRLRPSCSICNHFTDLPGRSLVVEANQCASITLIKVDRTATPAETKHQRYGMSQIGWQKIFSLPH